MTLRRSRRSRPHSNKRSSRGIALIAVLWAVMLLALMAQSFTSGVRTETQLTRNLMANSEARALADAAVHSAIDRLLREKTNATRAFDGTPYRTVVGGANVEVSVQDESGKVDLNRGLEPLLERLFASAGLGPDEARALVDAIADWRDSDTLRRVNGAERSEYRQANRGYEPKNRAFDSIEELRLVLGVSPALYEKLRPAITVHSQQSGVDLRAAPLPVLAALTGDETQAREIRESRSADRGGISPPSPGSIVPNLPGTLFKQSPRTTFTIRAVASLPGGAAFAREAVIRFATRRDRPYMTLDWRRGELHNVAAGLAAPDQPRP